jgi:2-polyprenyl-6-methoxyphenol hydroxylase-like FAD-dependent oxidoreductase
LKNLESKVPDNLIANGRQYTLTAGVFAFESLAGRKIHSFIQDINAGVSCLSPTLRIFFSQHKVEPILSAKCEKIGAELRFNTEVTRVEQDEEGCISTIRDRQTGQTTRLKSKYVVACDGGRSSIRRALGINRIGYGEMSRSVTIFFKVKYTVLT